MKRNAMKALGRMVAVGCSVVAVAVGCTQSDARPFVFEIDTTAGAQSEDTSAATDTDTGAEPTVDSSTSDDTGPAVDTASDTWEALPDVPEPLSGHCGVAEKRSREGFEPATAHPKSGTPQTSACEPFEHGDIPGYETHAKYEAFHGDDEPPANVSGLPAELWNKQIRYENSYYEYDEKVDKTERLLGKATRAATYSIILEGEDKRTGAIGYNDRSEYGHGGGASTRGTIETATYDTFAKAVEYTEDELNQEILVAFGYKMKDDPSRRYVLDSFDGNLHTGDSLSHRVEHPYIRDMALFADGRRVFRWGRRQLFTHYDYFKGNPTGDADFRRWWLVPEAVWPGGPKTTGFANMQMVDERELLTVVRDYPAEGTSQTAADRLYKIDGCGRTEQVWSGPAIADEMLKVGDKYIVRSGNCADPNGPSYPVLVGDGKTYASLDRRCTDIVRYASDRFACLAPPEPGREHHRILHFDRQLDLRWTQLVAPGGKPYDNARLQLAAKGGALAVVGHRDGHAELALLERDTRRTVALPDVDDIEDHDDEVDRTDAVLNRAGVLSVLWADHIVAIQTRYEGLARTSYPRAWHGGNQNRGWIEVDDD